MDPEERRRQPRGFRPAGGEPDGASGAARAGRPPAGDEERGARGAADDPRGFAPRGDAPAAEPGPAPAAPAAPPGPAAARGAARAASVPGWQQPELAWLIGMPLGFVGPWMAGVLQAPLAAVPLAVAAFLAPWALLLRASRLAAAQVGLCAFAVGCVLAWIDGGLLGQLQASPLEALGLPAPWLPDASVALEQGGQDRPIGRIALAAATLLAGWGLSRARLGALALLPAALYAAELGAGFGRVAAAASAERLERAGVGGGLSDGAAALIAADPGSVLLGLGTSLALGGLALGRRLEGGAPASPDARRGRRAVLSRLGLGLAALGVPLALFAAQGYRDLLAQRF